MTREEAIELKAAAGRLMYSDNKDIRDYNMLIDFIESTLCPVSREQVEKVWRGEWEVDEFGHKCSKCGEYLPSGDDDIFPQFCPNCGDAKTDEAVEMVMENLEALNEM